jgi:hypothetical protein
LGPGDSGSRVAGAAAVNRNAIPLSEEEDRYAVVWSALRYLICFIILIALLSK